MLNEVLLKLEGCEVFKLLGPEASDRLVREIVATALRYDCNPGEILLGIGRRMGICYCCLGAATEFKADGLCRDCLGDEWDEWDDEGNWSPRHEIARDR